jgi:transketolase
MTYEEKLIELAQKDPDIMIVTAENRAAIRNIPDILPAQFVDTGIAEQTMVGVAAGLALRGRKPIIHALATFLTMRAFEFIRTDIGIPSLPVKMIGAVSGFLSEANGPTHQAIEDIALMRGVPVRVFCPSDEEEMVNALPSIMDDPHPYYIRFNSHKPVVKHKDFAIGKAEVIKEPAEITILTYGFLLREAIAASEILENKGFRTGVINMRMLNPVDNEIICAAAESSALTVILEDHLINGGLYSIVAETLFRNKSTSEVLPIALKRWFKPAMLNDVLAYEGFTGEAAAEKIISYLKQNKSFQGSISNAE